jgi:hypothetical protein
VQNCEINLDFDLFLKRKSGELSPRVVDHARVAGPRVHHGPHSGRRPEFTGAWPSGRSRAWQLAVEAWEAKGQYGDPSGGLTLGREAASLASSSGEERSVAALSV